MIFCCFFFIVQQYKYRDLTVREITTVISQYKDLKPVMDAYGKVTDLSFLTSSENLVLVLGLITR